MKRLFLSALLPALVTARDCSAPAYTNETVGWQSQSCCSRGSWTISACLATIGACTWTIQHMNIPAVTDGLYIRLRRKVKWMAITVLFPEVILIHAGFQFQMAWSALKALERMAMPVKWPWYKRLRKWPRSKIAGEFKSNDEESGKETEKTRDTPIDWTIVHCYYANMGGFLFYYGSQEFRLTAGELANLPLDLFQGGAPIAEEDINDKSKHDWLAKTWAGLQILQLILSVITRYIQDVEYSQLEMVTLSFAVCGVVIYFTNIHKPQNVDRATKIKLETPISLSLKSSIQPYDSLWAVLRNKPGREVANLQSQPDRIPNDSIPFDNNTHLAHPVIIPLAVVSVLFGLIHAIAWNFDFATPEEKLLWRVATGASAVSPVFGLITIPLVQITKSTGLIGPELFVGNCIKLLQEYRWHCPVRYPVNKAIEDLETSFKGFLRREQVTDEIQKHYSNIFGENGREPSEFLLDVAKFLSLEDPYRNFYQEPQRDAAGPRRAPIPDRLDVHDDEKFKVEFARLVKTFRRSDAKKLKEEARTDMWPRKNAVPSKVNKIILYGTSIVYCISRLILLGIAFSSLRRMPGTVYIATDWTAYLVFLGAKN